MEGDDVHPTREEVESMVENAILKYHNENTTTLHRIGLGIAELRERVIGIDGNGTGRVGAIQRIERTLANQNKMFIAAIGCLGAATVTAAVLLFVEYVKFHSGWK